MRQEEGSRIKNTLFWGEEAKGDEAEEGKQGTIKFKGMWGRRRPTVDSWGGIHQISRCLPLFATPPPPWPEKEGASAAGVSLFLHVPAGIILNTSGTNLRRIKFPKSHERMACKVEREAGQCSPGTNIFDTAPVRKPVRWRSSGPLSSWTLTRFSSELQQIVLIFSQKNEKRREAVTKSLPLFSSLPHWALDALGMVTLAGASFKLVSVAFAAGFCCNTSSLQPHSVLCFYSCKEGLLAFGKRAQLPDPNEKSCLLSNAQTFRQ